jgi:hypothetical protein
MIQKVWQTGGVIVSALLLVLCVSLALEVILGYGYSGPFSSVGQMLPSIGAASMSLVVPGLAFVAAVGFFFWRRFTEWE